MKKIMTLLLMGILATGTTACGNNNGDASSQSSQSQTAAEQSGTSQETTQSSATADTSVETSVETESDTEMDYSEGWSEEMTALREAIVEAIGEDYWPNTMISQEMLEAAYGVTSDMYEDYMGEMPMISTNVDTLLIVKAKSDKVEDVEAALNAYRDKMVGDTMQYPMNLGKIQASRIERIGDYVCFVQLGADTQAASESGEEAVITQCQQMNDLVIEVIAQNV